MRPVCSRAQAVGISKKKAAEESGIRVAGNSWVWYLLMVAYATAHPSRHVWGSGFSNTLCLTPPKQTLQALTLLVDLKETLMMSRQ